jgi:hypothetical protein
VTWSRSAAVAALAAVALVGCGGSSSHSTSTASIPPISTSSTLKLDSQGQALISLITKNESLTYHAVYTALVAGTTVNIELWQKPPDFRRDETYTYGTLPRMHNEEFKLNSQLVGCVMSGSAPFTCQEESAGQTDPSQGVIGSLQTLLGGRVVTSSDATESGRAVRCFSSPAVGTLAPIKICVTPDQGIPVVVQSSEGTGSITLAALDTNVPASVFSLPATATPVTSTTAAGA